MTDLRKTENLAQIVDAIGTAACVFDRASDGSLRHAIGNDDYAHLAGLSAWMLPGQRVGDLFAGEGASRLVAALEACVASERRQETLIPHERAGTTLNLRFVLVPLITGERGTTRVLATVMEHAGEGPTMQDCARFMARMSHELRTPLNAIIGFSEVIRDGLPGHAGEDRSREYAGDIRNSAAHLLGLINDILDWSRIGAGNHPLQPEVIGILQLLADTARMVHEQCHRRDLKLEMRVAPGLPRVEVDRRAVRQMLLNLVGNAIKFTPAGGEISLEAATDIFGVVIAVRDTGPGMSPEECARMLEPFRQGTTHRAGEHDGVGLGLAIVDALVKAHGGHVALSSLPGKGTTVRLHLPWSVVVREEAQIASNDTNAQQSALSA